MADRFYNCIVGGDMANDVTEAAATDAGAPFEFRWTYTATGANKLQAIKALEAFVQALTQDTDPPNT